MDAKQTLNAIYNVINEEVTYNPEWENGTGYLDYAVINAGINVGLVAKSITAQGRKILMIGTRSGTVVCFERYTDPESSVVVFNMPREVERLYGGLLLDETAGLSSQAIMTLTGHMVYSNADESLSTVKCGSNVGQLVENLFI
jgi:hypothetical protein